MRATTKRTSSRKKRDHLLKSIRSSPLANISEIKEEQSGLHFILKLNTDQSDQVFIQKCRDLGINISTISEKQFMINYSSIPIEKIDEAITRICKAI